MKFLIDIVLAQTQQQQQQQQQQTTGTWQTGLDWIRGNFGTLGAEGSFSRWISNIIQIALILAGVVAVIFLIYGGYMYVTAGGNAEQAAAARTAIFNSIIGLAVILAAYAIISWLAGQLTG